jgi:hypothetical protein
MPVSIVSEVAKQIGANPKDISDLFYQRKLDVSRCPIVGGRRLIPEDYIPEIKGILEATGRLRGSQEVDDV